MPFFFLLWELWWRTQNSTTLAIGDVIFMFSSTNAKRLFVTALISWRIQSRRNFEPAVVPQTWPRKFVSCVRPLLLLLLWRHQLASMSSLSNQSNVRLKPKDHRSSPSTLSCFFPPSSVTRLKALTSNWRVCHAADRPQRRVFFLYLRNHVEVYE